MNLSGVYWCNNWCLHPPSLTLPFCSAPLCPPHNEYTCIQTTEVIFSLEGRQFKSYSRSRQGDHFLFSAVVGWGCLLASGFNGEKEAEGEKWKSYRAAATGPQLSPRLKSRPFPLPSSPPLALRRSLHFWLTAPIRHPSTPGTAFLPPVFQMKRNNDYGD